MKAGHILAAAISGVVLLQAACAAGDEGDIRRLIMEDCSAAKAHALQLPADQKPQLVQHLILVLKLRQQVPVDVAASGPSLGLSLDDLRALEVSRSFQPGRENEAKRCAIEILDAFGEISAAALPAMAGTHSDRTLPEDLAFSIEVAAYSIAQAVSAGSMQIGQEPARELVQFSPASYLARNLLYDLQAKYVDPILNLLQNSNDNERGILVDVLSNFDGQEQKIGEKALQIYQGAGPELKGSIIELASRLAGLHQNFFAIFVYEATTSGSGLADKADRALEGVLEQSSQIICEPASILNLVQAFKSQREGDRELYARVLEKACAGQEAVEAPILEIVSDRSAPLKLRVRSLRILVAPGEVSERTATKLLDLASDSEVELRLAAIEALGLAKNRKAEATRLLLKILKSNAKESDVLARQQVLLSAVASLALLGADLEPQTIMPYIVEGLAIEESHPDLVRRLSTLRDFVVKFFSNSGKGSLQSLVNLLSRDNPLIRKRVLGIIALVAVRSQALSNAAARLLDDPSSDVRENARLALAYQAEEFPAPALKALGAASATTRQAAARVVSALAGKISISESEKKRAVNAMKEGISKAACPLRATLVAELAVLSKADAEAGILIGCLAAMTDRKQFSDGLVSLERLAPLSEGDAGNFLQTTQNPPLTERLRSAALQASTKLGIRTDLTLPHWEVHLNSSDSAIQEQALLAIGEMGPAANPALDRLRESLGRFDKHSWLGVLTAVTLARIDTTAIDFTRILVSALESENYHLGAKAVSLLPDHLALSVAGQALEKLPTEHTFAAVLSIGLLGDSAKELVPALKSLAIRQDRQLRFHLVLALLRIDPGSLTGSDLLDSVLVGGYYEQLLAAQIPEHALPVIEALAREGKGLLVRRRAQDLALEISR